MAIDYASVGLRIKHARTRRNLTQEQLAEALKISRNHLSQIEIGEKGLSLELLVEIANTLHTSIEDLLADNLDNADKAADSDLGYILLDSTEQEEKIITTTAKALKAALKEQGI